MSRALTLIIVAVLATGCATRAAYNRLRTDVATLRGELTDLRQAQEATSRDAARVTAEARALDARQAEVTAAQRSTADEVTALRGRLETAQGELRDAKSQAVATAAPPPAAPASPTPPVSRPRESVPNAQTPEQAYQAALATFRAGEFGQAVLDFVDFMAKYPKHSLVANAQYWIGEAYYGQRDYRQAIAEFQKVLDVAPSSPKVPDALLKIGLAYRGLRDESRAQQTWDRIVKDYPKSEAAPKARTLLRTKDSMAVR